MKWHLTKSNKSDWKMWNNFPLMKRKICTFDMASFHQSVMFSVLQLYSENGLFLEFRQVLLIHPSSFHPVIVLMCEDEENNVEPMLIFMSPLYLSFPENANARLNKLTLILSCNWLQHVRIRAKDFSCRSCPWCAMLHSSHDRKRKILHSSIFPRCWEYTVFLLC